jgi:SAM-dependent methyltransferase
MTTVTVPRGHRHHQLTRAVELLGDRGALLDLGAGSAWLAEGWAGPAVATDVFAPATPPVPWAVASTERLPFADGSFDRVALLASLGAFRDDPSLHAALAEVRRVLRVGGRAVALASVRRPIVDACAPHRIRSRWRWRSFEAAELTAAVDRAGFRIERCDRYGGWRTLATDWAVTVAAPLLRRTGREDTLVRIGEWDAAEFRTPDPAGRYVLLEAVAR